VAVVFGSSFPVLKTALDFFPPIILAVLRNYLAAGVLFAYVLPTTTYRTPRTRHDRLAVLAGGAFLIGGTGIGFVAQQFITAGLAAIIFSLTPIVTGLLAWVFLPAERLGRRDALGVLVGFLGVALVIRPDPAIRVDPTLVGKALFFVGVAVVALGTVLIRRNRPEMPVTSLTAWSMLLGATILLAFAVAAGESPESIRPTLLGVATLGYLVGVGAVGLVLFLVLMADVGAVKANLTTYVTPVVAIVVGAVALGERLDPASLVGFAVILAGFLVMEARPLYAELARYRTLFR
jgi:drug/metabolite transporter (DMT)-like permease